MKDFWPVFRPVKQKGRKHIASGPSVQSHLILDLDEAFFDHLLVAEPQIGDVG